MGAGRKPDGPIESAWPKLKSLLLISLAQRVAVQCKFQTAGHDDRIVSRTQRAADSRPTPFAQQPLPNGLAFAALTRRYGRTLLQISLTAAH